jgi:epoxyqueuosine reductase
MLYNLSMTIDSDKLGDFIEEQGWSAYGIVPIQEIGQTLKIHEGIFEKWLDRGFQAGMGYLEGMKKDRYHPENKLPDVQSVIVLQAWYGSSGTGGQGIVARYAWGRDYHKILKKKLVTLSEWLHENDAGLESYLSVDSGPTVDRVLAEAAGLGFFGKNTNLIDPSKGSYFFIGSLLVNAKLSATKRRRMPTCGDCQRCTKACPTGAIVAPHTLDARRCIAYLTIENKDGIPPEFRSAIGNRLFGCDICQEVCPFNEGRAGRQSIQIDDLKAENGVGDHLDLHEILAIGTDEEYVERFAGTPLMRAGRRGLIRNACIVAGNTMDESIIPLLKQVIGREQDEMIQEHANWAISEIENRAIRPQSEEADG